MSPCDVLAVDFLQAPGPLGELAFWRDRLFTLNCLSEELKQPVIKKIVDLTNKASAGIVETLKVAIFRLKTLRVATDDNARYLALMESLFMVSSC